jgi:predicted helicase
MPSISFDAYLKSIQKNLQEGSERSHYPALKELLDDSDKAIDAVIEEKGNKAGIPDFTVKRRELLVGYVEAKDVGIDLDQVEKTEQLKRYLEAFPNLVLTNYLEFRWYVNGKRRQKEVFADRIANKLQARETDKIAALLDQFLNFTGEIISSPEDLATQMAILTKAIRLATATALEGEDAQGELRQLKQGFSEVLLPELNDADFADMYAQTISYGLFAARVGHAQNPSGDGFTRRTAGTYIPATNPFLKRLFNTIVETDVISQIDWAIEDLVQVLSQVDMGSILENFGRRTRQEDPVVHFYETFLAAYNSVLRKSRGVYYTPEPVVSFIVRSIDAILKDRFELPLGLADNAKDPVTQKPRVQILDPATGTGTFLYEVVKQIYRNLEEIGMANQWDSYVKDNLLNRLFGFELLMAPYAIAHLKLGLELQELGYRFQGKQRLGIYLTNTLDEALKKSDILFGQFVAQEANEASAVKRDAPVMVVLGNPPYSGHSANKSEWIAGLVKDYYYLNGLPLGEQNSKYLQDDYVKFIRFGQWRVNETGYGVLAFITNHGYLDNPTFRGMRQNLMQTFTDIYVLDLHGNSKKKEVSPDGSPDKNVFDIQQGVSIGIFIKEPGKTDLAKVYHADVWGDRLTKYELLNQGCIDDIDWKLVTPQLPFYLFCPQNTDLLEEYNLGWKITEIMPVHSTGVKTHRDHFVYDFEKPILLERIKEFRDLTISNREIAEKYFLVDTSSWKLSEKRRSLAADIQWKTYFTKCLYRPFDTLSYYSHEDLVDRSRRDVMRHIILEENLGMVFMRQVALQENYSHFIATNYVVDNRAFYSSKGTMALAPLYLYPDDDNPQKSLLDEQCKPNLSQKFLDSIREKLGYVPTPEAIFYYIYAIFHSPTYRQRYAEFLKIDFPCVPLTSNDRLFKDLGAKGEELVALHLMTSKKLNKLITKMSGDGDNAVTEVTYSPTEQRVYINLYLYFEGTTSDVWKFKIGGYQVLDKWLKDRKKAKRTLSFDDVLHYQKIVVALKETMQRMEEIDQLIPGFPIE